MAIYRVLAATAVATACGAQGPPLGQPDKDAAEERNAAVLEAARAVLAAGSCREATAEIADAPRRLEDPRLRGAVWQPVRVEGCGRRSRLNMLAAPAPGGGAAVTQLLPGATVADPLQQREGLRLAVKAVKDSAGPNCERIAVNDTRAQAGATAARPAGRPWGEVWTLSACGRAFAVPLRFAPVRDGTEITVDPDAVRPLG